MLAIYCEGDLKRGILKAGFKGGVTVRTTFMPNLI